MTAAQSVGPTAGPPQAPGQQPTFTSQSFRGGSQQRFAAGGTTATNTMGAWGSAGGNYGPTTPLAPSASNTAPTSTAVTMSQPANYTPPTPNPLPTASPTSPIGFGPGGLGPQYGGANYGAGTSTQPGMKNFIPGDYSAHAADAGNIAYNPTGYVTSSSGLNWMSQSLMRRGGSIPRRMYGGGGI